MNNVIVLFSSKIPRYHSSSSTSKFDPHVFFAGGTTRGRNANASVLQSSNHALLHQLHVNHGAFHASGDIVQRGLLATQSATSANDIPVMFNEQMDRCIARHTSKLGHEVDIVVL